MKINEVVFPYDINEKNSRYFYIPYILMTLWIVLSIISVFMIGTKNLFDGFVIFSIIIRIAIGVAGLFFLYNIFIKQAVERNFYNYYRAFIGYGIVFTYVFYSLPRMVGEFNGNIDRSFSIFSFVLVLIISAFPVALYIFIRYTNTRIALGAYTQKDVEFENKLKKDKKLKKKEMIRIRSERSILENLWYDWIDVIVQAIIIALIIQQFVFQMYQIPSESMVPTFIIGDRVVVNKAVYGPHIPLTDWKLPSPIKPKVGDIVVFKNPEAYDDPNSDLRYKNVFVRIFHPFIYMLTLSFVDIDKKDDGSPKERFLVKRLIAKEGEKLCIVNDKVYKKTKDTKWTEMSQLQNQREYGQVDLYYDLNPKMNTQTISSELRDILNSSQSLVDGFNIDELQNMLINEKKNFLNKMGYKNLDVLSNIINNKMEATKKIDGSLELIQAVFFIINKNNFTQTDINYYYGMSETLKNYSIMNEDYSFLYTILTKKINRENIQPSESKKVSDLFTSYLDKYHYSLFINSIDELYKLSKTKEDLNKMILDKISYNPETNPYDIYMKKFNALYKIYKMKIFSDIINDSSISKNTESFESLVKADYYKEFHKLYLLNIYIYGIPGAFSDNFIFRNYPEYPEDNVYLQKDEYFVMGDNRYNSFDVRFGRTANYQVPVDSDDTTDFSVKFNNNWKPHTITINHILGKAVAIYWPMNRSKFLK